MRRFLLQGWPKAAAKSGPGQQLLAHPYLYSERWGNNDEEHDQFRSHAGGFFPHSQRGRLTILDFPPAPKLNVLGKLDPKKATETESRGQELFFGKAECGTCHPAPYYKVGVEDRPP
jgi:hypothetical protein